MDLHVELLGDEIVVTRPDGLLVTAPRASAVSIVIAYASNISPQPGYVACQFFDAVAARTGHVGVALGPQ